MGEIVFRKLRALFPDFLSCEKRHRLRLPLIEGTDFFGIENSVSILKECATEILTEEPQKSVRDDNYVLT